jgi:hypothetical protein
MELGFCYDVSVALTDAGEAFDLLVGKLWRLALSPAAPDEDAFALEFAAVVDYCNAYGRPGGDGKGSFRDLPDPHVTMPRIPTPSHGFLKKLYWIRHK